MRRARITITLNGELLNRIDNLVDGEHIRNRSHAIEYVISRNLQSQITTAVILAGGKGSELRPITYEVPKSLLPIKGKPLLEHLILKLKKAGVSHIVLCVGYLGHKIKEYFGDGKRWDLEIMYSEEKEIMGTGGAVLLAKKYIKDKPFLLIHGDIITDLSFTDLINFHMKEQPLVTAALTAVAKPAEFGQLALHGTKLVTFFQKNPKHIKSHLVNCGIYACEAAILDHFPSQTKSFYFEDVMVKLIRDKKVNGFVFNEAWFDVANPTNYERAIKHFRR